MAIEQDKKIDETFTDARTKRLMSGLEFDEKRYEYSDKFVEARFAEEAHTVRELVRFAEKNKNIEIVSNTLCNSKDGFHHRKYNTKQFVESFKKNDSKFKEYDPFAYDSSFSSQYVGDQPFIPLLGGPFFRQMYMYDTLRMHSTAFWAYNHTALGRRFINLMCDFVMGRGFRVDVIADAKNKAKATGLWRAFEEVNNWTERMEYACRELSIYGEVMAWKLPNNELFFGWNLDKGQEVPRGLIPRYRFIDPSTCWEIICYPEDIERKIAYQLVYSTAYNMYTAKDGGKTLPTMKFVMTQVPAEQVIHIKKNSVSNEKRGRSDLMPALGYIKRSDDIANYAVIRAQKNAAWAIDTTIQGSGADLDAYVQDQQSLGTIARAGSEFVHTDKVKREYLANQGGGRGSNDEWEMCVSMACAAYGVPVSYLGLHVSGGQTRSSAVIGTEPVTKLFEKQQVQLETLTRLVAKDLFKSFGIDADIEVTFPELISQDSAIRIKNIQLAQDLKAISHERASSMIAKELAITEYDYNAEQEVIENESPEELNPLPSLVDDGQGPENSGVDGGEKAQIKKNDSK